MDWIFSHIWIIVALAGVLVRVFQAASAKSRQSGGQPPEPPKEYEFKDAELAERTQKIREEIRRKIEERRSRPAPPVSAEPNRPRISPVERSPQATPPPVVTSLPEIIREVMNPTVELPPPIEPEPVAEVAAEMPPSFAEVERLQAEAHARVVGERRAVVQAAIANRGSGLLAANRAALLQDLRDPAALRRAIILREVLGPPLALRR
jgi:hypothetical protein